VKNSLCGSSWQGRAGHVQVKLLFLRPNSKVEDKDFSIVATKIRTTGNQTATRTIIVKIKAYLAVIYINTSYRARTSPIHAVKLDLATHGKQRKMVALLI
jgi:hypothetical protein